MKLDQIIIRPAKTQMILQYSDPLSRANHLIVDTKDNAAVAAVVADAQQRLPTPQNRPDKAIIQKEIAVLEARLEAMKESIGAA